MQVLMHAAQETNKLKKASNQKRIIFILAIILACETKGESILNSNYLSILTRKIRYADGSHDTRRAVYTNQWMPQTSCSK